MRTYAAHVLFLILSFLLFGCAAAKQGFTDGVLQGLVAGTWKVQDVKNADPKIALGAKMGDFRLILSKDNSFRFVLAGDPNETSGTWKCHKGSVVLMNKGEPDEIIMVSGDGNQVTQLRLTDAKGMTMVFGR